MFARSFSLVFLCACATSVDGTVSPDAGTTPSSDDSTFRYLLGEDPATGEQKFGGSHDVVDMRDFREAVDSSNTGTALHPELTGSALVFDETATHGETDWEVFPSSWWPQSQNGIAQRYTGGTSDLSSHSDEDNLSPVEKYDLVFNANQETYVDDVEHWNYTELLEDESERGPMHTHPSVDAAGPATAWELENHGMYQDFAHPDSWWGHCNGWASYATTEEAGAPERDIRVKLNSAGEVEECASTDTSCMLFRMGDIEALMTEVYFGDTATFTGRRCNTQPDDIEKDANGRPTDVSCRDVNPATFHVAAVQLLNRGAEHLGTGKVGKPPFVIDHSYDYQVWNFPLVEYTINETEWVTEAEATELVGTGSDYTWNTSAVKFVRVSLTYGMVSDSVSASSMLTYAHDRNVPVQEVDLHYVLELDANDTILGGEWIAEGTSWYAEDSKEAHPDFLWIAMDPVGAYENADDSGSVDDNPYLRYDEIRDLLDCANDASTCAPSTSSNGGSNNNGGGSTNNGGGSSGGGCDLGCMGSRFGGPNPLVLAMVPPMGFFLRRRRS